MAGSSWIWKKALWLECIGGVSGGQEEPKGEGAGAVGSIPGLSSEGARSVTKPEWLWVWSAMRLSQW